MARAAKGLAAAATIGMLVVLLMGTTVTNTGSAEGCGRSWPLCHGQFIPAYAFATMVEYSHRLVTGVEGFLIAALAIAGWSLRRRYPELRLLIPLMVLTLLLQSGMGAWAVMAPQTPAVMATHFGISLTCFASVFLIMRVLWEGDARSPGADLAVPAGVRWLAWGSLVAITVVAYLGAFMRHASADLACATWPLCNGALFPGFDGAVGIAFGHRLAALASMVLVAALAVRAARVRAARPDLARLALASFVLILLQALAGGAVVLTRLAFGSALLHAALMALLFVALADCCRRSLPQPRPAPATTTPAPTVAVPAR